jgi:hypothetical protein
MRRFITLATALTALAVSAGATQLPLTGDSAERVRTDPSFPQPGVMDGVYGGKVGGDGRGKHVGDTTQGANLADTLTLDRRAEVWWEYARDVSAVSRMENGRGEEDAVGRQLLRSWGRRSRRRLNRRCVMASSIGSWVAPQARIVC